MDWNEILKLPAWTPLQSVCCNPVRAGEGLYEIGQNQFVMAMPYDSAFRTGLPDAPFITAVYWAQTVESARRCALRDENQPAVAAVSPPHQLLLGTNGTYRQLLASEQNLQVARICEQAVYSGKSGQFIHKVIQIGNLTYCFGKIEVTDDEKPYAIEFIPK